MSHNIIDIIDYNIDFDVGEFSDELLVIKPSQDDLNFALLVVIEFYNRKRLKKYFNAIVVLLILTDDKTTANSRINEYKLTNLSELLADFKNVLKEKYKKLYNDIIKNKILEPDDTAK